MPDQRHGGTRAHRESLELGEPLLVALVAYERRRELLEVQGATTPVPLYMLEPRCLAGSGAHG